ncbi:hypothetical protein HYH03_006117 [Edaphochlamys debaryana]|uniref:MYND-type domain-containing protein n=1 Tax=Edaphochlamys debaryana TaxID=47281 RepID=A0A836C1U0_9CHLO|nr:hypothetical protein HYH03_006117 [Edaphochlamys debaryana]|eukprot:KAG2495879.1 hypothetical protein HYH03_006117 [Edaphochlamys debaryana]
MKAVRAPLCGERWPGWAGGGGCVSPKGLAASLTLKEPISDLRAGPCARLAAMALGLAALRALEAGGAEAGGVEAGGAEAGGGGGGAACPCMDRRMRSGSALADPLQALAAALDPTLPGPVRPVMAAQLLLRVGFTVASSGGDQWGDAAAAAASGAAGGSQEPAPLPLMPASDRGKVGPTAFLTGQFMLARNLHNGPWPGIVSDTWRLAAALLRDKAECTTGAWAAGTGTWLFPAAAPRLVAAALAGGALPLLERLLRRAGDGLGELQAFHLSVCSGELTWRRVLPLLAYGEPLQALHFDICPTVHTWCRALPLLAYGEPLQASALLATATKLLRRTEPRALLMWVGSDEARLGLAPVLELLNTAIRPWRSDGPSPPALRRLALVLSLALPEWLPELWRLIRAVALDAAADWGVVSPLLRVLLVHSFEVPTPLDAPQLAAAAAGSGASGSSGSGTARSGGSSGSGTARSGGSSGTAGSGGSGSSASGGGSPGGLVWPPPGLPLAEVVGAARGVLQRRGSDAKPWMPLYHTAWMAAWRVALTWPEEVLALDAAGSPFAWRSEGVRAVAAVLQRERGVQGIAEILRDLGALLGWTACGDGSLGAGQGSMQVVAKNGGVLAFDAAAMMVPLEEARRRLGLPPACANPACANLAGDSEAGLRLRQCGACGRASYCSREGQTAHWRSGHKEACGRASGGGEQQQG